MAMDATTITIKLSELQRPLYDPYLGRGYRGNHRDLIISRERDGDIVTETVAWQRDPAGNFAHRREQSFSAAEMVQMAEAEGFVVTDDIPQGFILAM